MTMPTAQNPSGRIVFLDYARVAACFLVILVHAAENFYAADASGLAGNMTYLANEANRFWVSFYDGLARVCVPLFMIISSYLLVPLKEGQTMGAFYRKRFLRVVPPMVFFMLLYTFLPLLWGGMTAEQSMQDFRGLPLNFPSMAGHLWFMYPLLGLYLFMPVISPWLERATRKEEQVFLGIFLLSTFMPFLHRFVQPYLWGECFWNGFHMLWYFSGYIGYLVLAHYVRFHLDWPARKRLVVGAAAFLAGAAFTIWSFYWKTPPGVLVETPVAEWAWEFCTPNVLCATFGAFLLFSCIRRPSAVVEGTSRISFGIYLVHLFVLNVWVRLLVGEGGAAAPAVPVAAAIPLIALCTFLSSALIVKVFSLIPGSRWLIG